MKNCYRLIQGDCLNVLPVLENNSVDLVITDPPYGSGGKAGAVHFSFEDTISGNKMGSDAYTWMVKQYSRLLYEKSKDYSHCYVFSDWRRFLDVRIGFEVSHWELRSLIVWDKANGMGEYWRSCHEFILFFTKRKPRKLNSGRCMNVLHYKPVTRSKRHHSAEKPRRLIAFLMEASSNENETVLDPFLGSGTTMSAAQDLGRSCIGIEINPDYCEIVRNHCFSRQFLDRDVDYRFEVFPV